jgi:Zn-dependent protease
VFDIRPENLILIAIFLGLAFPIHEFAHAFTAWRLGDSTAKLFGRLTLNPVVHFDPFGGLMLAITALSGSGLLFGWAKPTPVNTANLRDRRNGEVLVSLAGPVSNALMAVAGALVWRSLVLAGAAPPIQLVRVLYTFVAVNVVLAVFNLIPVPPLDGSALLFRFLSPATAWRVRPMLAQYGPLLLMLVIFTLVLSPAGYIVSDAIYGLTDLLLGR